MAIHNAVSRDEKKAIDKWEKEWKARPLEERKAHILWATEMANKPKNRKILREIYRGTVHFTKAHDGSPESEAKFQKWAINRFKVNGSGALWKIYLQKSLMSGHYVATVL